MHVGVGGVDGGGLQKVILGSRVLADPAERVSDDLMKQGALVIYLGDFLADTLDLGRLETTGGRRSVRERASGDLR